MYSAKEKYQFWVVSYKIHIAFPGSEEVWWNFLSLRPQNKHLLYKDNFGNCTKAMSNFIVLKCIFTHL